MDAVTAFTQVIDDYRQYRLAAEETNNDGSAEMEPVAAVMRNIGTTRRLIAPDSTPSQVVSRYIAAD